MPCDSAVDLRVIGRREVGFRTFVIHHLPRRLPGNRDESPTTKIEAEVVVPALQPDARCAWISSEAELRKPLQDPSIQVEERCAAVVRDSQALRRELA